MNFTGPIAHAPLAVLTNVEETGIAKFQLLVPQAPSFSLKNKVFRRGYTEHEALVDCFSGFFTSFFNSIYRWSDGGKSGKGKGDELLYGLMSIVIKAFFLCQTHKQLHSLSLQLQLVRH